MDIILKKKKWLIFLESYKVFLKILITKYKLSKIFLSSLYRDIICQIIEYILYRQNHPT